MGGVRGRAFILSPTFRRCFLLLKTQALKGFFVFGNDFVANNESSFVTFEGYF